MFGHVGAIVGLSGEDLGAIWVNVGGILCHVGAFLKNLEATWFNVETHSVCEMNNDHFTLVLLMFLELFTRKVSSRQWDLRG